MWPGPAAAENDIRQEQISSGDCGETCSAGKLCRRRTVLSFRQEPKRFLSWQRRQRHDPTGPDNRIAMHCKIGIGLTVPAYQTKAGIV